MASFLGNVRFGRLRHVRLLASYMARSYRPLRRTTSLDGALTPAQLGGKAAHSPRFSIGGSADLKPLQALLNTEKAVLTTCVIV